MDQIANHISKTKKYLAWCDSTYLKILEDSKSENENELEKNFITLLGYINSIHESLVFAGKKVIGNEWAKALADLREQDELLYYFWTARNKVTHDTLISWRFSMASSQVRVVNPELLKKITFPFQPNSAIAMLQLFYFLYGAKNYTELINKIQFEKTPSKEKLDKAGVDSCSYNKTFCLNEFKVRTQSNKKFKVIKEPKLHLGKSIAPSANLASKSVIEFYKSKLCEVESKISVV